MTPSFYFFFFFLFLKISSDFFLFNFQHKFFLIKLRYELEIRTDTKEKTIMMNNLRKEHHVNLSQMLPSGTVRLRTIQKSTAGDGGSDVRRKMTGGGERRRRWGHQKNSKSVIELGEDSSFFDGNRMKEGVAESLYPMGSAMWRAQQSRLV